MIGLLSVMVAASAATTTAEPAKARRPEIVERNVQTGSRIRHNVMPADVMPARAAAELMRFAGDCVVRVQRGVALRTVAASTDYGVDFVRLGIPAGRLAGALSIDTCLTESAREGGDTLQWQFGFGTIRNFLIEPLYLSTFKAMPNRNWEQVEAVPVVQIGDPKQVAQHRMVAEFGECVVRANFGAADTLIRTDQYSENEKAAFEAVKPSITACLDQGSTISMRKPALRALIADAAWRLANGIDRPVTTAISAPAPVKN